MRTKRLSDDPGGPPVYRLKRGRESGQQEVRATPSRLLHVQFPIDLFNDLWDDCKEADVARILSQAEDEATVSDYVRAACLLLHRLLAGPTRGRVMNYLNLDEQSAAQAMTHLVFRYAAPPAPSLYSGTGVVAKITLACDVCATPTFNLSLEEGTRCPHCRAGVLRPFDPHAVPEGEPDRLTMHLQGDGLAPVAPDEAPFNNTAPWRPEL